MCVYPSVAILAEALPFCLKLAEATSLRENSLKEAAAFTKESGDMQTNVAPKGKASDQRMGGSFLQTTGRLPTIIDDGSFEAHVISKFLAGGRVWTPELPCTVPLAPEWEEKVAEELNETLARIAAKAASLASDRRDGEWPAAVMAKGRRRRGDILRQAAELGL